MRAGRQAPRHTLPKAASCRPPSQQGKRLALETRKTSRNWRPTYSLGLIFARSLLLCVWAKKLSPAQCGRNLRPWSWHGPLSSRSTRARFPFPASEPSPVRQQGAAPVRAGMRLLER